MTHDFVLEGAPPVKNEDAKASERPTNLPLWRDEDHQPPEEHLVDPANMTADAQSVIDDYTDRAIAIAQDNRHGYSQANRWGPDYDCSSLVITVLQDAGIPAKDRGATFTGNMREVLLSCGFKNVTSSVNLATGAGLKRGDILLNDANHTAIYIGNEQLVHARTSEGNPATGDQSGNEIRVQSYYNYPWNGVFRYCGGVGEGTHVPANVQDSQKGARSFDLRFPYLKRGSTGAAVIAVQFQLMGQGYSVGPDGADGDYGSNTEEAMRELQLSVGLTPDGIVGPATAARLFGGEVIQNQQQAEQQQETKTQDTVPETTQDDKNGILDMFKKLWRKE